MKKYKCILLIDDDQINSMICEVLIKKLNIAENILMATEGELGLKLVEKCCSEGFCPEIIFLDVNMMDIDGFEFLEKFAKMEIVGKEHCRIIMVSSAYSKKDMSKIKELGITEFIVKPLSLERLKELL